jgi:subtilase family serine protease
VTPRRTARVILAGACSLGLAAVSAAGAGAAPSLGHAGTAQAEGSSLLGPARPEATVSLTLVLRLPGRAALAAYIAEQRQRVVLTWLTPAQIGERFGLPSARVGAVIARLRAAGIRVTERYDQRTALLAEGSVHDVDRLFHVRLDEYQARDGSRYRIPSRPPRVPADLADAVSAVDGLDTRPVFHPTSVLTQTGSNTTYVTPQQLAHIYGGDGLAQAGIDGSGETIAIASLATAHGDEFAQWAKRFKVSLQPSQTLSVAPAPPTPRDHGWSANESDEVALDLEMARALAPKATLLDYTTANDGGGIERVINQITQDRRATIVSISYGICEVNRGGAALASDESTFMTAQAAGIDIFAASGDSGPHGCNEPNRSNDVRESVSYPASSAYVTAVGGTTLLARGNSLHEVAWQEPASLAGSGGGRSAFIPRPPWQSASVVHEPGGTRLVPDVAGPASPDFNLAIAAFQSGHVVFEIGGGTSASAPFWAGVVALVKQSVRGREHAFPDGNVNAMLYQIGSAPALYPSAFNDITTGSNQVFTASTGWDFMTGLGSPNIDGLTSAIDTFTHSRRS